MEIFFFHLSMTSQRLYEYIWQFYHTFAIKKAKKSKQMDGKIYIKSLSLVQFCVCVCHIIIFMMAWIKWNNKKTCWISQYEAYQKAIIIIVIARFSLLTKINSSVSHSTHFSFLFSTSLCWWCCFCCVWRALISVDSS